MAMAEKLSVQQLQQAVQSGSLPAYIGIPLIEQKTKEKAQMAAAQGGQQKPPSVAASILQQAEQQEMEGQGIDQLPSNLPMMDDEEMGMAGGGIVAFADRGLVQPDDDGLTPDVLERLREDDPNAFQRIMRQVFGKNDPRDLGGSTSSTVITPSVKDVPFTSGAQTGGGASLPYRRQRGASNAPTPPARPDFLPQQDLSLLQAPDYEGSFTESAVTPTTVVRPRPEGSLTAGITPANVAASEAALPKPTVNTRGAGNAGTGQGAPTAKTTQAAPTPQAPATQSEGQSALDKYAEMLMAERAGSDKARAQAKGMSIFQAGLGIMGGTSPNALANIAQGALPATQAYQQEIKGIRAEDAARMRELMGLGVKKEKLALEAKKLGISEKRFEQMYELEKQKIGIMGGSRADAAQNSEALRRDQLAKGYFELFLKQNPMATEAEMDVFRDRARAFAARDSGGTVPSATNKYAGFSIVK